MIGHFGDGMKYVETATEEKKSCGFHLPVFVDRTMMIIWLKQCVRLDASIHRN